jgi:peptidoglycan/xylan/chitin deacetylase (PgdA/CDA1 family)
MEAEYTHVRALAFTVDVDRDVNLVCHGQICSVSKGGNGARFTSSGRGLELILQVLEETGVKGTFFWEGRTAEELSKSMDLAMLMEGHEVAVHGYDHEDFSGKETGIPLEREQVADSLDRAESALDRAFGRKRRGFRAPYQRTNEALMNELLRRDYLYDSSETVGMTDGKVFPYRRKDGLLEAPVCWSLDRNGKKIVSYLWPYHEGKRPMNDYLEMVAGLEDGLLVLATHSWHPVENFSSGELSRAEVERGVADLRHFIEECKRSGAEFVGIADHLRGEHDL